MVLTWYYILTEISGRTNIRFGPVRGFVMETYEGAATIVFEILMNYNEPSDQIGSKNYVIGFFNRDGFFNLERATFCLA